MFARWVMAATEKTVPKQLTPFKPGQSGNPAGRPKGARNKLGEAFLEAMLDDFTKHGVAAIQTVRADKPDQYLKVIASILPKEMNLNVTDQLSEMSDDELADRARRLARDLAPLLGGIGSDTTGVEGESRAAKPAGLH
jgi:Family of unknown function (DUF5681)